MKEYSAVLLHQIKTIAEPLGYQVSTNSNPYVILCRKLGAQVVIYWNKKSSYSGLFSVATALNHPKLGRTQLQRKNCNLLEVEKILKQPRVHTGKGYYKK